MAKILSGELLGSFVQGKIGGVMGSPYYMAPEQWLGEDPNAKADLYSLGVIMYEMLCGDVPFKDAPNQSIMMKHLKSDPPTFAEMGVHVPPDVEAVVRRALEKEAINRQASVDDFILELATVIPSQASLMTLNE